VGRQGGGLTGAAPPLVDDLAADWTQYVLTDETFEQLGPAIQDLVMHAVAVNYNTEFRWKLVLQYRWKNGNWQDADITPAAQTNGN